MTTETWTAVDDYITGLVAPADPALDAAQEASRAAGLPAISVSAAQGKFLHLLARIQGARRILEIGTLGGYSTIWLGPRAAAGRPPRHARVRSEARRRRAREHRARRAVPTRSTCASAAPSTRCRRSPSEGPFDLIFIDADKPSTTDYFHWALKLSRRGTVIVVDNVVRDGKVVEPPGTRRIAEGMRTVHGGPGRRAAGERDGDPDGRRPRATTVSRIAIVETSWPRTSAACLGGR